MVLVGSTTEYMDALTAAFAEYEIPLFAAESRLLDRHPLARLLLETMRLLSGADADLSTLLLTGYAAITDDEGDRMLGYIARNGLRARDGRFGLETMCVGGGQGMAIVVERLS